MSPCDSLYRPPFKYFLKGAFLNLYVPAARVTFSQARKDTVQRHRDAMDVIMLLTGQFSITFNVKQSKELSAKFSF